MGIIDDATLRLRAQYQRPHELEHDQHIEALLSDLRNDKVKIVSDIIDATREFYIQTGELRATSAVSGYLAGNTTAQDLIASWLQEEDPSYVPTVRIYQIRASSIFKAQVSVRFTPVVPELVLTSAIVTRLSEIIEYVTGIEASEVTSGKSFVNDLDIDSLSEVEIIVHVEDQFGIKIPDKYFHAFKGVDDIVEYLLKEIREQPERAHQLAERHGLDTSLRHAIKSYAQQ